MSISFQSLKDSRDRALSSTKTQVIQARNSTWKKVRPATLHVAVSMVSIYRLALGKTVFIGINGSCGKTTAKEMISTVLSSKYQGVKSRGNSNVLGGVLKTVLRTRREHDFCVQEFNVGGIGEAVSLDRQYKMFRPKIGVMTNIGDDHISAHGSREAIAAAKGKMIAALPRSGTAILNADDHLVLGMQSRSKGRVITYGLSDTAMVRGEDIRDDWPNRLSLTIRHDGDSARFNTQFCGEHLVPSILASVAAGRAMGVSLQDAAKALEGLAPIPGRMFPIESPDGVTFLQDDVKAPVWAIPATLEYMQRATAKRKIIVFGSLSDYQTPLDPTYAQVARQALEVADFTFFVGRWASRSLRAKRHPGDDSVQAFVTVEHLNGFLRDFLQEGDLVLIKGSHPDHLSDVISAWMSKASASTPAEGATEAASPEQAATGSETPEADYTNSMKGVRQLIVGLGNPGTRFEGTPHNVGQRTLELLADMMGATWTNDDVGIVARASVNDRDVLLVKPEVHMNRIGPWMRKVADDGELRAKDCLMIHDDIHLKPGVVRNRMSGSSGGHKGVQSVVAAFQSEDVRRVKIGVGLPTDDTPIDRYVLAPFKPAERDEIEAACREAASRTLDMIKKGPGDGHGGYENS